MCTDTRSPSCPRGIYCRNWYQDVWQGLTLAVVQIANLPYAAHAIAFGRMTRNTVAALMATLCAVDSVVTNVTGLIAGDIAILEACMSDLNLILFLLFHLLDMYTRQLPRCTPQRRRIRNSSYRMDPMCLWDISAHTMNLSSQQYMCKFHPFGRNVHLGTN